MWTRLKTTRVEIAKLIHSIVYVNQKLSVTEGVMLLPHQLEIMILLSSTGVSLILGLWWIWMFD